MTRLRFAFAAVLPLVVTGTLRAADPPNPTVGMPGRMSQVILPGTELEVKPLDDPRAPIVLRITEVYKHGTAHRYDLIYYGLEPGTFDLKNYLQRKDGSSAADVPALPVTIDPVLPPGQILPNALESRRPPWLGGYKVLAIVAGVLWLLGLLAILLLGRRKKAATDAARAKPMTLAERLRPMVEGAMAGRLTEAERADLERTLLAFWRRRLHLESVKPVEAIAVLRRHPDAGPLLDHLEVWLHRPGTAGEVDVTALLRPYKTLPAEALEMGEARV